MNPSAKSALSARQVRLVRESFESLREYEDSVVLLFYGRLFEIAPETRAMFKIDMHEQARKLMETLRASVETLDRFEELFPVLQELGRKHVSHGVEAHHYERLRAALLWAMGQALGLEFDRETRAAWDLLISTISTVMLEAAQSAQSEAR